MTKKCHFCKDCTFYKAYYTKSVCDFELAECGFCTRREKSVKEEENCDVYKKRKQREPLVTVEHIDKVMEDVEYLEAYFYDYDRW